MNKIIYKFLLTGDKFMPKLYLKQTEITYSSCGSFTKHCKRIQKFWKTGNLRQLYRNKLDKACYLLNAAYSHSSYLAKETISDKILKYRHFKIARNRNYDVYQRAFASMVYTFLDEKTR